MLEVDGAKTRSARKATGEGNIPYRTPKKENSFWGPRPRAGKMVHILSGSLPWAARRKRVLLYIVGVAAALFAVLAPTLFYQPATASLRAGGKTINLQIAATEAAQEQGLGGRRSMSDNQGMLFTFDQPNRQCFWMKDMRFPLDIIWLNSAKQVVYLRADVSPKTYPEKFCPSSPARYVIELNAGQAAQLDIRSGQTLQL